MFAPRLADLLEPLSIVSAATHSVNILRNKRMIVARQSNPSHVLGPFVAGIGSQSEAHAASDRTIVGLLQADQIAHDDIGAWNGSGIRYQCWQSRGFHIAVCVELFDFDGLHRRTDRDFANDHTDIRSPAENLGKLS